MKIQVETHVEQGGAETLRRLHIDGRLVEVSDQIDQWHGADYRYVKVRTNSGDTYILRYDKLRDEWTLTMYQRRASTQSVLPLDRRPAGGATNG
jgi:hypothetical protein